MNYCRQQAGSALTEFFVMTLVMVPAFAAIPILAKISDANQSVVQASRYVAFEATLGSKSSAQLSDEVNNRFMADPSLAISTEARVHGHAVNKFWQITNSEGNEDQLLKPLSHSFIRVHNQSIPDRKLAAVASGLVDSGDLLSGVISNADWRLEKRGLITATVSSSLKRPALIAGDDSGSGDESCPATEDSMGCISRSTAIFVDEWYSGSAHQAEKRSRALVPAAVFRPLGNALAKMGHLPLMEEMRGLDDAFGKVDSSQVPEDRLGPWEDQK